MAPTRSTISGPLVAPAVCADIIRDYVAQKKLESAERGTSRIDEAGHLVLLRDAGTLDAQAGEE